VRTTRQEANSTRKVLILGSSVANGMQSQEARAVQALPPNPTPFQVEVVTPAQWKAMTAEQFMSYRALIIGDAGCTSGTMAWQAALETRETWGAIVDGNIIAIGSNVASNSSWETFGEIDPVVLGAIDFAVERPRRTGMYIALGCAYQNAPAGTPVELLTPFGTFEVAGMGCVPEGHVPAQYPPTFSQNIFDGLLIGMDGCSAKSVFTAYPQNDFSIGGLAVEDVGGTMPGAQSLYDYDWGQDFTGTPFILTRGATSAGLGCGGDLSNIPSGEECDLGDSGNGSPYPNYNPSCSWACKLEWCGDGVVQPEFGEQCDNGSTNGRDVVNGGIISNGMCTTMCRIVSIPPPPGNPPVARCQNVTVAATDNTCGAVADINNGSSDPDPGDIVTCTQNPAGPYSLGQTTVTLTCSDQTGKSASCSGTVTVTDGVAPTISLTGPAALALQCGVDTYTEQGATANDTCPAGSITPTIAGTVNNKVPAAYTLTYTATDAATNSARVTRTATVSDTLKPTIILAGSANQAVECRANSSYVDPGASVSDACASIPASAIVKGGSVNMKTLGTYPLTYDVTDPSGNAADQKTRIVTVQDRTAPVLTVAPYTTVPVECGDPNVAHPPVAISDTCFTTGPFTAPVPSRTVNTKLLGGQTVTYTAKDPAGNTGASGPRTFQVSDTLQPTLTLLGASPMALECGDPFTDPGATANDQCAGNLNAQITKTGTVDNRTPATYDLEYSVTDGRTAVVAATRAVTVSDTLPPSIALNGPASSELECGTAYSDPTTASDVCAGDLTAQIEKTGSVNPMQPGSYPLSYSVTDPSGLSASASRTVMVKDTVSPVVTMLGVPTAELECGTGPFQDPGATASDSCFTGPLTVVPTVVVDQNMPGTYTIQYKATDPSGNTGTAAGSRTVTVSDTQEPALALNGAAVQALECGTAYNELGATASDVCRGVLPVTIAGGVNHKAVGSYSLDYSAADGVFTKLVSRTVDVSDTLAPDITVLGPTNDTLECGSAYVDPGATASDVCAGDLTAAIQSIQRGDPTQPGTVFYDYRVTDPSGNTRTVTNARTVAVNDNEPPVIVLNGAATLGVECGDAYTEQGARAFDACFGDVTSRIVIGGMVNTAAPGSYTRTYNVTDQAGQSAPQLTRTINVADTVAPVIAVLPPVTRTFECGSGPYVDPGATASDTCAGDLTGAIVTTGTVDSATVGSYTRTYSVTDPSGQSVQTSRQVSVSDTLAPSIALVGPTETTFECGTTYQDPGATASDSCAGDLTAKVVATSTPVPGQPGTTSISYSVTDPSGNTTTSAVSRTVRMIDEEAPVVALLGSATEQKECGTPYADPGATASDTCSGPLEVTVAGAVDHTTAGSYTLTYTATDLAGNTDSKMRTVTVTDTQGPVITINGANPMILECNVDTWTDPGATATDLCSGAEDVTASGTVNVKVEGLYEITYRAVDNSGNPAAPAVRNVLVQDTLHPVITLNGPSRIVLECGLGNLDDDELASVQDECHGDTSHTVFREFTNLNIHAEGDYIARYQGDDTVGHVVWITRDLQVVDTTPPVLTLLSEGETVECGAQPGLGVTATDACYGPVPVIANPASVPDEPGQYRVTYSAVDPAGNFAGRDDPLMRIINVEDTTAPTVTLVGDVSPVIECGEVYLELGATAEDQCDGEVVPTVAGTVNSAVTGTYTLTYSAVDLAENTGSETRTVRVVDTTAPVLSVFADETIECGSQPSGVTAADACHGQVPVIASPATLPRKTGVHVVTYSAVDPAGNSAMRERRVTVEDTTAPTVRMLGQASQVIECGEPYSDPGAEAEDPCDGRGGLSVAGTVNSAVAGTYSLTYSARDSSGNASPRMTRTVTVKDSLPPSIVCPPSLVAQAESDGLATVTLAPALAEDSCSEVEVSGPSERRFPLGSTTVTYVATDASGNTASCTSTVVVEELPQPADWDQAFLGGGRGCSSTGGGSSLSLVGFLALLARFARKRQQHVLRGQRSIVRFMTARLLVLAVLLVSAAAFAQPSALPEFELERLKLNPSGKGSLLIGTGELLPDHGYRFALTTHYENDPLVLYQNGTRQGVVVRHRATAHLSVAYGLWKRVELGAQVPLVLLQRGDDLAERNVDSPRGGMSLGTPLLSARLRLLAQRNEDAVDLSVGILAGPRIGQSGALARELRALPSVMVGRRFGFLLGGLDAGLFLRPRTILSQDAKIQDELGHALRLGATLATTGQKLRGELAVIAAVPLQREGYSVETLAGARLPLSASTEAYGLAGLGYGNAPGTPDFRVLLGVAYGKAPPACVAGGQHEPLECPDLDDDSDGVVNRDDACPRQAGRAELQGCPSTDMDSDGLEDGEDACPSEPGPSNLKGCPHRQTDEDGVLDAYDACPDEPGIIETQGCPPRDSDGDTVWDHQDNCPNASGPADNQGCPAAEKQLVAIQKDRIEIHDTVHFEFDEATIQPRSFPLLDQVARVLLEHPEIAAVTIEGHTDETGSADYNRELSQRRAEAVRDYFVQKGVATERLEPRGFGEDRPLRSNDTEEGRAANRRVEFITRYAQSAP
jgi:outer membrane protein OmpA-like peptidoglycan-associated protein